MHESDSSFSIKSHDKDNETIQDMLNEKNKIWFRIVSGSMKPLIDIDDIVLVNRISHSEVKKGDVILFRCNDVFIAHRVTGFVEQDNKRMIRQKGDASGHSGLIEPETVIGKVVVIGKKGKLLHLESLRGRFIEQLILSRNWVARKYDNTVRAFKFILKDKPGYNFFRSSYHLFKKPFAVLNKKMIKGVYSVLLEK